LKNRIGFGYDVHRLAGGRPLYLGGVEIPHLAGLAGHSDGDALIHALIDALLGAAGEDDIGCLFPDTEPEFKGIRSTELLSRVMDRLRGRRLEVLCVDSVIVAEAPLLAGHSGRMKETLSPILGLPVSRIGIKAKTNEGLGPIGEKKAVACWAVALVGEKRGKKS
jgi:2-C-methyl-D-erythritol 2,4-cyclodiphosphate synthase